MSMTNTSELSTMFENIPIFYYYHENRSFIISDILKTIIIIITIQNGVKYKNTPGMNPRSKTATFNVTQGHVITPLLIIRSIT